VTTYSTSRPRDWNPLAASDPVPGDAEEIRDEVTHMKNVASTLRDQASNLRKIKEDDELKGKYAGKLRDESEVLEKHLREVASRYERVHVHLSNWANDLVYYQGEADKVLANAKKEQEAIEAENQRTTRYRSFANSSTASRAIATTVRSTTPRKSAKRSTTSSRTASGMTSRGGFTTISRKSNGFSMPSDGRPHS
jgi:predicted RNase H-like nuclease (RuvC/YqgF family)